VSSPADMKKPKGTEAAAEDAARNQFAMDLVGGGSLDKVRDILFGSNMRDYEKRFSQLEERLAKEAAELRAETKRRLDALEAYAKREIDALNDRLKSEHTERVEREKEATHEVRDFIKSSEKKLTHLDESLTKAQRELREHMLNQSKDLSEEISRKADAVAAALERAVKELRTEKTDRLALASLFTEVAMRLNNQLKLPGAEG
jgi:DNA repair exonuclease SbcCD ATPase subunit